MPFVFVVIYKGFTNPACF